MERIGLSIARRNLTDLEILRPVMCHKGTRSNFNKTPIKGFDLFVEPYDLCLESQLLQKYRPW